MPSSIKEKGVTETVSGPVVSHYGFIGGIQARASNGGFIDTSGS